MGVRWGLRQKKRSETGSMTKVWELDTERDRRKGVRQKKGSETEEWE